MSLLLAHQEQIFEICATLSEVEDLKVTLVESGKGALMVGMCTFAGGLLGGPVGLALGGTVSSIVIACSGKQYRSAVDILKNDLTNDQKWKLTSSVQNILKNFGPQDVSALLALILANSTLKEQILKEIGNFFLKELSYKMVR